MRKTLALLVVLLMLAVAVSAQDDAPASDDIISDDAPPDDTATDDILSDDAPADDTISDEVTPEEESAEEDLYAEEFEELAEEDIYEDIGDVELQGRAGITPDSPLYVVETFIENLVVGSNPERALDYKQQKMLEVKKMIEAGNAEAAEKAMARAEKYNEILQREVTPDMEVRVRESSKATKKLLESFESELGGDEWGDFRERVEDNLKTEDRIALAAKVSSKIKELCEVLSGLDPLQYAQVCKTGDDAPRWKKNLDKKLTQEQEKEAKKFFGIMSQCFQAPRECRCGDISIKPFAEKCNIIAPLAAACEEGDEQACEQMDEVGDPIDLLPDYLQDVMMDIEDEYGDAKQGLHLPRECAEAGATSREACMKVMFRLNAPPECTEALERGEIDPKNEREARGACEAIMWELEAPDECKEAGLRDHRECERYMFRLGAPQECLDAGLTGSGRDDWKKCELIRFKIEAPAECIEAGITGENRDDWKKCELIKFKAEAPQECLDAGITGENRDDWKKCEAIRFKSEAHPACLAAGLTGSGRDDWKKCQAIQFKAEAPPECLAAGLTGEGRDDWKKCERIRGDTEGRDREERRDEGRGGDDSGRSECSDGCSDECPGASRTDCVNDRCECYYEDTGGDGTGGDDAPPADGGGDDAPPADGGGDGAPPADGGGDDAPPADGGGDDAPPSE